MMRLFRGNFCEQDVLDAWPFVLPSQREAIEMLVLDGLALAEAKAVFQKNRRYATRAGKWLGHRAERAA